MDDGPVFTTLEASQLGADLLRLLCRIAREKGRLEITNCPGGNCVVISKAELDALEEALEILSRTDGAEEMRRTVEYFAMATEGVAAAPA